VVLPARRFFLYRASSERKKSKKSGSLAVGFAQDGVCGLHRPSTLQGLCSRCASATINHLPGDQASARIRRAFSCTLRNATDWPAVRFVIIRSVNRPRTPASGNSNEPIRISTTSIPQTFGIARKHCHGIVLHDGVALLGDKGLQHSLANELLETRRKSGCLRSGLLKIVLIIHRLEEAPRICDPGSARRPSTKIRFLIASAAFLPHPDSTAQIACHKP